MLSKYKLCPVVKERSDGATSGVFRTETIQVSGKRSAGACFSLKPYYADSRVSLYFILVELKKWQLVA